MNDINNNLISDVKDKASDIEQLSHQIKAFEDRVVILIKERKYLKELIRKYNFY